MSTPTATPTTETRPPSAPPPLERVRQGRMIAGVCAGIAERYGFTRTQVRVAFVLSCLLPGPQFIAYLALWALMPLRAESSPQTLAS